MFARWTSLAILVSFVIRAQAQQCSLYDGSVDPTLLFDYPSFSPTTPIIKTWTTIENNALRIVQDETNGGTVGYAWHFQKERIADGFVSTFKFKIPTPASNTPGDGFTYFIQNDKIVDLNGGSGSNLGAFGIARSIAVSVDLCPGRPNTCGPAQLGLKVVDKDNTVVFAATPKNLPAIVTGTEHTITVVYGGRLFGPASKLKITFQPASGSAVEIEEVVGDLTRAEIFNGRFAHFGFTASSSWTDTANIDIVSWKTNLVPSDSAIDEFAQGTPFRVEFGTTKVFKVIRRDSCKNKVVGVDNAVVTATLLQRPLEGQDPEDAFKLKANVTFVENEGYQASFNMPPQLQATWDMDVQVDGVSSEGMPFSGGVETFKPVPAGSGLPIWALILLLLLILLIILVLSYVVYRLHRYRKKLQQNAEFIEAGKKQAELDKLENGVAYSANRMVGTIDDLKSQLQRNEEELAKLRQRGALGEDQNFTIQQLQKQRDDLLEEMNRLKREEQEEELKKTKPTETFGGGGRTKKEFGREQI